MKWANFAAASAVIFGTSLLGISILFSTGCGQFPQDERIIDEAFGPYVADFEADAAAHGKYLPVSTSVRFGDPTLGGKHKDAVGICMSADRSILIKQSEWDRSSDRVRKVLIYHELGHCELGQIQHRDDYEMFSFCLSGPPGGPCEGPDLASSFRPASIMNSHLLAERFLTRSPEDYLGRLIDELFASH